MSNVAGPLLAALAMLAPASPFDMDRLQPKYEGEIRVDGSTQVYYISDLLATHFKKLHPKVEINVARASTGPGFQRFAGGETHINNASRAIDPTETASCEQFGIKVVEFQVAWDAVAVVVHKDNTWADKLTVEQLRKIWRPDDDNFKNAKKWSDVDPNWPKEDIKLAGLSAYAGLGKVFAETVNGEAVIRDDYVAVNSSKGLPAILTEDKHALAFMGQMQYERCKDQVKTVAVAFRAGGPFVAFSPEAVADGRFLLRRPMFIYVNRDALEEPQVLGFVAFHFLRSDLVREAGYIELTPGQRKEQQATLVRVLREKR
jgi:phosphate transport system substrate-binding protein